MRERPREALTSGMGAPFPISPSRRPGEPTADLTDYRVLLRALRVDVGRLARCVPELATAGPARRDAAREYLHRVLAEARFHQRFEQDTVWPVLEAVEGPHPVLIRLTDEHRHLEPLQCAAAELGDRALGPAASAGAAAELATALRRIEVLLDAHVDRTQQQLLPLIAHHLSCADYAWMQRVVRRDRDPRSLPFVVAWMADHATAAELDALVAIPGMSIGALLGIFHGRFTAQQHLALRGEPGPSGPRT